LSNLVILNLQPLKWRGISLYVSEFNTTWSHRQVERAYPYVDVPGHDWTGFDGFKTQATIHFLNTIEPTLYPERWVEFRDAIVDGSTGPLEHPDLGEIKARPMEGSLRITAQSTAGILVTCSWAQTRDTVEDDETAFATSGGDSEQAEAADEGLAALTLIYPDGEPDSSLSDTVGAIEGAVFTYGQQIGGAINQAQGLVGRHIQAIDLMGEAWRHSDPSDRDAMAGAVARAATETLLYNMYDKLGKKAEQAAKKARPTSVHLVTGPSSLAALAGALGNTLDELLTLNPSAASSPTVTTGAKIQHYVGK
jgi:hypothetical protein